MSQAWQELLAAALTKADKIAVLGIGSQLKSDDAAGMRLIEELEQNGVGSEKVLLLAGSTAPENLTSLIRVFEPDLLLAVDAARLGLEPGAVALLPPGDLDGLGFSTHMLPFSVMLRYLQGDSGRELKVLLLGIEPVSTEFGLEISAPVAAAVAEITDFLLSELQHKI